jgi:hypothetical protein
LAQWPTLPAERNEHWAAAWVLLAAIDQQHTGGLQIVPGYGPLGNIADLTKSRDMLVVARDRVQKLKAAGKSGEEIAASKPLADLDPEWGHMLSSDVFVQMFYLSL